MEMQTSSPNSKKCSTVELARALGLALATLAAAPALALVPATASIRADLRARSSMSFDNLTRRWQKQYGADAVSPLLDVASDRAAEDADRYVAIMSAAKLGGSTSAPLFTGYLKDPSWMIRSAALKALTALQNPDTAVAILPLSRDPALVVRLEAIYALEALRPEGVVDALVAAIEDRNNYHAGRAQWVPQRALQALAKLRARAAAPKLRPLLDHGDLALKREAVATLDSLAATTLQGPASSLPLAKRVQGWKVALDRAGRDALSRSIASPIR